MASDDLKRNIVKILTYAGLAYVGYKIIEGLSKNKSASEIVKDTVKPVETVAQEVKNVTKKFLKGSAEAKAHMAKLRSMNKTKRGEGKRAKRKKSLQSMRDEIKKHEDAAMKFYDEGKMKEGEAHERKADALYKKYYPSLFPEYHQKLQNLKKSKAEAGKLGGEATAELGQHKGHETSEGLKQDQSKNSSEKHEKHYRKSKKKRK